jgi:hypothetical protein
LRYTPEVEKMTEIIWDREALKNYNRLTDPAPKEGEALPFYQRQLLANCITLLKDWHPTKWFDLRNQDGFITFQLESDKFAEILGFYNNGVIKITHLEIKLERGK